MSLHALAIQSAVKEFRRSKGYAERAFAQIRDEDFFARLNPHQCSIAAYVRHLAGNMRSRWTDFLTTDGEKPGRDREGEFAEASATRAELMAIWEAGWDTLFASLASLAEGDLERTVTIRREPMSAMAAVMRQVAHYAWHAGQIALLAKHLTAARGEPWEYMTVAPGGPAASNRAKGV